MNTLSEIKTKLGKGGVVILPTETVYGIAAKANDAAAISRIYEIKGRDFDKPLAVCISGIEQAKTLAIFTPLAVKLTEQFWPGPLTLILPAKDKTLHERCYQGDTIALRCPDISWREALTKTPLVLTSANKSGEPDALTAQTDLPVDAVLDAGHVSGGTPSTILKIDGEHITLLREGALTASSLAAYDIKLS